MIARTFRVSFLQRVVARGGGGWQRPDPPTMVMYENRRTLGIITKFLNRNDGVAPAYFVNLYTNETNLWTRFLNVAKLTVKVLLLLSPLFLTSVFFGMSTPEYFEVTMTSLRKLMNRRELDGSNEKVRTSNPYGVEAAHSSFRLSDLSNEVMDNNRKHARVRKQGSAYINSLMLEVTQDMSHGPSLTANHH